MAAQSPVARPAPPVLLPYQQRWIEDKARFKVAEKGRRTGLTWAEAADDVLAAAAAAPTGQNVYYIAYNQDMTMEYIQACAMWTRAFDYAGSQIEEGIWDDEADREKAIKTFTIRFPSGFRIVALTSRPSNLRGRQGIVVIDEAAFHDKLEELLKAAMALIIWGGSVRVISTHNGDDNSFNELINDIRAGKRGDAHVHRIEFQQAVAEGLYRRVCHRLNREWSAAGEAEWVADVYRYYGDGAAEELDVIPSSGEGAWLSTVLIESRMGPGAVLRWSCPNAFATRSAHHRHQDCEDWLDDHLRNQLAMFYAGPWYYGMDFGRDNDLSVIAPCIIEDNLVRNFPLLIELRNVPFAQQEQVLFDFLERVPRFARGAHDARGNGQQIAEAAWQKYGKNRVDPVMLSEPWYRENMPGLKAAFQDGMICLPRDADLREDLRAVKLLRGVARIPDTYRGKGQDGQPRHADAAIALALAWYASQHDAPDLRLLRTAGDLAVGETAFGRGRGAGGDVYAGY